MDFRTSARTTASRVEARTLQAFLQDYEWIHTLIGLTGNLLFLIGSVLFLWGDTQRIGVWLFIVGAGAMFIGSLGGAIVRLAHSHGR